MKAKPWNYADGSREGISIRCEGCGGWHNVTTKGEGAEWTWNGDLEKPVLSPSVLVGGTYADDREFRCHSFVGCKGAQPGEIIYLSDCTHHLAGQVRPLLDWDAEDQEAQHG